MPKIQKMSIEFTPRRRSSHDGFARRYDLNGYSDYNYRDAAYGLNKVVPYIDSWTQEYEK